MAGPNVENDPNTDYVVRSRSVASEYVGEIAPAAATAAPANVPQSDTVVTLLSAAANRVGFVIENDSEGHVADLFVKFGSGASLSSYTKRIPPGEAWDRPLCPYAGIITGIWSAAGSGNARVTEEVAG